MNPSQIIRRDVLLFCIACFATLATVGVTLVSRAWKQTQRLDEATESPNQVGHLVTHALDRVDFQPADMYRGMFLADATMPMQSKALWWLPRNSEFIYIMRKLGAPEMLFRVSTTTGQCERLTLAKSGQYESQFGSDKEIHLLRLDTANNRSRLLDDIYSVTEGRMVATRTLLDQPRTQSGRLLRTLWSPDLATVTLTLRYWGKSRYRDQTHVVELSTGFPIPVTNSHSVLENQAAIAFSDDGKRLFLASVNRDKTTAESIDSGPLTVLDLNSGEVKSVGSPKLPSRIPLAMSDDTQWVVYASGTKVEIWDSLAGVKVATIDAIANGDPANEILKLEIVADGKVLAVANNRTLSLYAMETGRRIARFPDVPPKDQTPLIPLLLSRRGSDLLFCGISPMQLADTSKPEPWIQRVAIAERDMGVNDESKSLTVESSISGGDPAEWTSWLTDAQYSEEFQKQVARDKYPITVVGRNVFGTIQFRGRFVDRPDGLAFVSRHNTVDNFRRLPFARYHNEGFREIWRQWFVDASGTTKYNVVWTKVINEKR